MAIQLIIDQQEVEVLHLVVVHVGGLEDLDLVVGQQHHLCQEEGDEVKESV